MALPPEQINIKRRREEEPVETLYIQSELPQTKRRFTDFLFQRVRIGGTPPGGGGGGGGDSKSGPPTVASTPGGGLLGAHRSLRSPRSASSLNFPSTSVTGTGGVPIVRATSPGAEFRDAKRLVAARREAEEKLQRALHSSATTDPAEIDSATSTAPANAASVGGGVSVTPLPKSLEESPAASPSPGKVSQASSSSVRRFQISRSSTPVGFKTPLGGTGVQKKRSGEVGIGGPAPTVAILVEKLRRRTQPSKKASMVELALKPENVALNVATVSSDLGLSGAEEVGVRSRKRPVVNQAEKRWREERQVAISAAKEHLSMVLEKEARTRRQSNWEEEEERLAREFAQIALEIEGQGASVVQTLPETQPAITIARAGLPKPVLKYSPRSPNGKAREAASAAAVTQTLESARQASVVPGGLRDGTTSEHLTTSNQPDLDYEEEDDTDGEYVYDTYIRRPLPDGVFLNPSSVDKDTSHETWLQMHGIDTTRQDVGVIVIPQEDEEYWEHFAEDDEDEDQWDSEDADSNAENNPANDYPEEELSSGDEDDDPAAIYSRNRHGAASDEEDFDVDEYGSEGEFPARSSYSTRHHVGESGEDEDQSDS